MKLVTWNCNGAFRKKLHALTELETDLMVIQECEDPSRSTSAFNNWANEGSYIWKGENKNKGIGIFAQGDFSLQKLNWDDEGLELFLPCRVNNQFNLLGVWTKEANSPTFGYIGQFWKYLRKNKSHIARAPIIICGDFNSNKRWDLWDRWWNHSDVVKELEEINIVSLYHMLKNEPQGDESQPTLYMHRKPERPYHIDYAFIPEDLCDKAKIVIGSPNIWLEYSDHMPLSFSIDWSKAP